MNAPDPLPRDHYGRGRFHGEGSRDLRRAKGRWPLTGQFRPRGAWLIWNVLLLLSVHLA